MCHESAVFGGGDEVPTSDSDSGTEYLPEEGDVQTSIALITEAGTGRLRVLDCRHRGPDSFLQRDAMPMFTGMQGKTNEGFCFC